MYEKCMVRMEKKGEYMGCMNRTYGCIVPKKKSGIKREI